MSSCETRCEGKLKVSRVTDQVRAGHGRSFRSDWPNVNEVNKTSRDVVVETCKALSESIVNFEETLLGFGGRGGGVRVEVGGDGKGRGDGREVGWRENGGGGVGEDGGQGGGARNDEMDGREEGGGDRIFRGNGNEEGRTVKRKGR